ncbi:hypothetical protein CcCBS67573_g03937 [Chytriomyces confervae]|uniref:G-protein coupled receptors family 3 profile domain-containing protein n=1 Tax=Chytriomyces confervae TaxID=246404 RepID=A0A507FEK0_9FUNG|nr:hypothetical protein CcCBS67573_g03937 [Chytriomyces confervae]
MNISIATVGNYCAMKYMTFNGSYASNFTSKFDTSIVNLNGNSGYTYLPDLAIMAAIDEINNDPSILPGVYVSLKRFSDCGSYYPKADAEYSGGSGGYASAMTATDIIENHKDVLGVIGNQFSNAARGLAQILSVEQIPYCAAVTGSPRFSDKNNYGYFWRMLTNSNGKYVAFILKYWNIKRIAIIYQADNEIGRSTFSQIKSLTAQQNVEILSQIGLKTKFLVDTIDVAAANLRRVDARYIIISGTSSFVASVIYPMGQAGLVGPNHVWIVHNRPKPSADVRNYRFLKGLITVGNTASGNGSLLASVYNKTATTAGNAFGRDYFEGYGLPGFYDCAYMMLLGFDKFTYQGILYLAGYSGLSMNPVLIDELGDQKKPGSFSRFTGDYRNTTNFAASDAHLSTMRYYNTSTHIFYNDSSIPPHDSNVVDLVLLSYGAESFYGQTIVALFGVGLLLSFASYFLVIHERKNKIVRSTSIPECIILITGCLVAYAGSITYINARSEALCKVRVWSLSMAQILIASPLISKSLLLVSMFSSGRIYKNDRVLKKMQHQVRILNGAAIVIEAVLLALWTFEKNSFVLEIKENMSAYWRCTSFGSKNKTASPFFVALCSYNGLMIFGLLVFAYLEKSVHCKMQDNSATLITVFISLALMILLIFELLGTPDFTTDFKVCVCIWVTITLVLVCTIGSTALDVFSASAEGQIRSSLSPVVQSSTNSETLPKRKTAEKVLSSSGQQDHDAFRRSALSGANRDRKDLVPTAYQRWKLAYGGVGNIFNFGPDGCAALSTPVSAPPPPPSPPPPPDAMLKNNLHEFIDLTEQLKNVKRDLKIINESKNELASDICKCMIDNDIPAFNIQRGILSILKNTRESLSPIAKQLMLDFFVDLIRKQFVTTASANEMQMAVFALSFPNEASLLGALKVEAIAKHFVQACIQGESKIVLSRNSFGAQSWGLINNNCSQERYARITGRAH